MPKSQIQIFIDYEPAELRECQSRWYINYKARNPQSEELERKQVRIPKLKSIAERRKYAKRIVQEINIKLENGWNPWIEYAAPKGYHKLTDTFETYLRHKKKELREASFTSYKSYITILNRFLTNKKQTNIYVVNFTKTMALDFLNSEYENENVGEYNYNNKLSFCVRYWNWLINNQYATMNPFIGIGKKKTKPKTRIQFIESAERKIISDYFKTKNYRFYVMSMLAFHCLIRPKEMRLLKVKYLNIDENYIFIPGSISKNGNDRYSTIPDVLINDIKKIMLRNQDPNDFLFSAERTPGYRRRIDLTFLPGKKMLDNKTMDEHWRTMRNVTGLNQNYQFYSLRDTGIIQKLRDGVTPDDVMNQADHGSLETTNKYVKIAKPRVLENVKNLASEF